MFSIQKPIIAAIVINVAAILMMTILHRSNKKKRLGSGTSGGTEKKNGFCSIEFSKRMLYLYCGISLFLILVVVIGTLLSIDVNAIAVLAGTSLVVDGTWGGFYLWKAKNENRAKYAQRFVMKFADKYGIDAAIRLAEVVLKD